MKTLLITLCIITVISCGIRKSAPLKGEVSEADPHIKNGKMKFMEYCQKCHPNGEGGLGPALNPVPSPGFIKSFQVRHGLGVMPKFTKEEISKSDLKDINEYLSVLRKK